MPAPTPVNSPSRSLPSTPPKKETEPAHSATSEADDATTPTAKASNAAKTTDPEATPKNAKRYSSAPDPPTTPSAQHGSIAAWGSTSGKLYLSGPRPDHANSVSGVWESVFGLRPKNATEEGDDAEKKAEKAEEVKDDGDEEKSGKVD